ncbi:NAD(P)/FAD-dependent oxidoreductase [Streptomyces sp. NBC_01530]|uniref:NAD(P)/FAD-dependent oxidoreductase n=1 Tax=Streptomyces sp. NBC_01530 TaxID=2903895 RepID=UPI003869B750
MAPRGVVVVGAGQGGLDTVAALRAKGYGGPVTLVGEEPVLPYQRPPLSKGFLTGAVARGELTLRTESFFEAQDIALVSGDRAQHIEVERQRVRLASGGTLGYDKLVLATGSRPRTLPVPGMDLSGVLTLRTLADAEALRTLLDGPPRQVVVLGAGFVGLELAATARVLGHDVTVVEAQRRVLARALTPQMSQWLAERHAQQGVRLLLGQEVTALHGTAAGEVAVVRLRDGRRLPADLVVVGVGALPNTQLAAEAGLLVGDGVVVDRWLRTDDRSVYAIGDCARFPSTRLGRHIRLESVQNASDQARCVAAAICGESAPYTAVPWFWSEQYALRLQMAGLTAGHDETVTVGDPDGARFSVLCFREGRLTGVESMGRPADHGIARRLLSSDTGPSPAETRAPGFDLKSYAMKPSSTVPAPA